VHRSAAQQLQQQVTPTTAPAIMTLARQQGNQALQQTCVNVMSGERKNDVFAVLDFALRFNLRSLQGSCLGTLRRVTRDRLVDKADRIMQVRSCSCKGVCCEASYYLFDSKMRCCLSASWLCFVGDH
jgi:hypothetical protein